MLIPIVMASDDKYAPYLGVALHSLIKHISAAHEYRIYILHESVSAANQKRILAMQTENVRIEFMDVRVSFEKYTILPSGHLPKTAAFRLAIDRFFPQYEKVLYLDCDIIVNRDVAELYRTDLQDSVCAAFLTSSDKSSYDYIINDLKFPYQKYFNSGILLINIPLFKKYKIGGTGLMLLEKKQYRFLDQDVLNLLCEGHVKYFDGRWNVEWHCLLMPGELVIDEGRQDIFSNTEDPYIIHYTSPWKPWAHPESQLAEYFWENAMETVFYEEILFRNLGCGR